VDCVIAESMEEEAETKIVPVQEINANWMAWTSGPRRYPFHGSPEQRKDHCLERPHGVFEMDAFSRGTFALAHSVANSMLFPSSAAGTRCGIDRAGRGTTCLHFNGGRAFLELLEGKTAGHARPEQS